MDFELLPEGATQEVLTCSDPTVPTDDSNLVIKVDGAVPLVQGGGPLSCVEEPRMHCMGLWAQEDTRGPSEGPATRHARSFTVQQSGLPPVPPCLHAGP